MLVNIIARKSIKSLRTSVQICIQLLKKLKIRQSTCSAPSVKLQECLCSTCALSSAVFCMVYNMARWQTP